MTFAQEPAPPEPIQDTSFLIEESYNQDPEVVQHISTFQRSLQPHIGAHQARAQGAHPRARGGTQSRMLQDVTKLRRDPCALLRQAQDRPPLAPWLAPWSRSFEK